MFRVPIRGSRSWFEVLSSAFRVPRRRPKRSPEARTPNLELRTRTVNTNMELGTWNLELGTWNLEHGTTHSALNASTGSTRVARHAGAAVAIAAVNARIRPTTPNVVGSNGSTPKRNVDIAVSYT